MLKFVMAVLALVAGAAFPPLLLAVPILVGWQFVSAFRRATYRRPVDPVGWDAKRARTRNSIKDWR